MWLSWQSSYLARTQLWVPCPGQHKVDIVVHIYTPSACEVETQDRRKVTLTPSSNVKTLGYPQCCLKNKQKQNPRINCIYFLPRIRKVIGSEQL